MNHGLKYTMPHTFSVKSGGGHQTCIIPTEARLRGPFLEFKRVNEFPNVPNSHVPPPRLLRFREALIYDLTTPHR